MDVNQVIPDCPDCGGFMRIQRNHQAGTDFYSCMNYPQCKGSANIGTTSENSTYEPTAQDKAAERKRLDDSRQRGTEEAAAWHERTGTPVVWMADLKRLIPGFGKRYDELTQADKDARAPHLARVLKMGASAVNTLPYDKNERAGR